MWNRDVATGCWNAQPIDSSTALQQAPEITSNADDSHVSTDSLEDDDADVSDRASDADNNGDAALERKLQQSLVLVTVEIPHVGLLDGCHAKSFTGQPNVCHVLRHLLCK